jgi:hypothetical protein
MSDSKPPAFEQDNGPKDGTTIELGKILDLIGTKQTQYYALWAVYTAVQFSAANYGMGREVSYSLALFVLAGFWVFNLGHLGFVLQCVRQLDRLKLLLKASVTAGKPGYSEAFRKFVDNIGETDFFWKWHAEYAGGRSYFWNAFVHLFIDVCASAALLVRAGLPTAE